MVKHSKIIIHPPRTAVIHPFPSSSNRNAYESPASRGTTGAETGNRGYFVRNDGCLFTIFRLGIGSSIRGDEV